MKKSLAGLILALVTFLYVSPSDPALPEVVYDRDGVAWTQSGERVEEDHPLWDCETMGNRSC